MKDEDDDDDPFNKVENSVFKEQRLLQDALDTRPERITYEQMIERASYKASVASQSVADDPLRDMDIASSQVAMSPHSRAKAMGSQAYHESRKQYEQALEYAQSQK